MDFAKDSVFWNKLNSGSPATVPRLRCRRAFHKGVKGTSPLYWLLRPVPCLPARLLACSPACSFRMFPFISRGSALWGFGGSCPRLIVFCRACYFNFVLYRSTLGGSGVSPAFNPFPFCLSIPLKFCLLIHLPRLLNPAVMLLFLVFCIDFHLFSMLFVSYS